MASQPRSLFSRSDRIIFTLFNITHSNLGIPIYMVASLLEMSDWGGTDATSLKKGIDSIFNTGNFEMSPGDYRTKLVSVTSDGASVNFGRNTGLLTQFSANRDWLLKIHYALIRCTNHRIELAVKDAIKETAFADNFYNSLFFFLKNSGKTKSEIKKAAKALNIQNYTLPKITGTRFVGHRRNAYTKLLKMWPAITIALENVVSDPATRGETKAKVTGFLRNNLNSYRFLCLVCTYLDVLELITPISKVFEGEGLLVSEIKQSLTETLLNIDEEVETAGTNEELLTSHLASFEVKEDETIQCSFIKGDDSHKSNSDKELTGMTYSDAHRNYASAKKIKALESLKELLKERFSDLINPIIEKMKWFDPKHWTDSRNYGIDQLTELYDHFKEPLLAAAAFDFSCVIKEWRCFKTYVKANYRALDASEMWKKIFQYKKAECPNLCIIVELVMAMSGSNSSVEFIDSPTNR